MAFFVSKCRIDKCGNQFLSDGCTNHPRPEHDHIHIVMLHSPMRGAGIVAEARGPKLRRYTVNSLLSSKPA